MLLSHSTAAGMNVHRFFPASFQVPRIWRRVIKRRRMSVTVRQRWPFIQHTGGQGDVNKGSRGNKKKGSHFISAGTWQRNKSNTKVQWALQISFHMQFVTSSEVHPLELGYCCCHYICYNAVLLEEALWPAHMSVSVCVWGGGILCHTCGITVILKRAPLH